MKIFMESPNKKPITESKATQQSIAKLSRFKRVLPEVTPAQIAVLVIDMQTAFRALWNSEQKMLQLSNFMNFVCRMKKLGCTIVRSQHGHSKAKEDGGMLQTWWNSVIIEGSVDHAFMPGFEPSTGDVLIPKTRYNAFYKTDLDQILKSKGIQMVVIGGVMTNLCCETTAREAFCRDYHVVFLADGTAAYSNEMQESTLLNLAFGFAHIQSCESTIRWLGKVEDQT